jgi:hypothetical protein
MSTFAEGFIKYGLDKGHIKPKEEVQKELDLIWASSFYLTEDLPKNFGKWSEKKLNNFWLTMRGSRSSTTRLMMSGSILSG